jgi:predicted Zn-dependent protease
MDLDWASAETEFKAAIEAHPQYTVVRQRFALFLTYMGRAAESRREMDLAMELGPKSPAVAASSAWVPYYQGHHEEALDAGRKAVMKHPGFSSAEVVLALTLVASGSPGDGALVLEKALAREPENVSLLSLLAFAKGKDGDRGGAEMHITELSKWAQSHYVSAYYQAIPHLGLGHDDKALSALERGVAERSPQLVYLAQEPIFRALREGPRFQAILTRIGLPYHPTPGYSEEPSGYRDRAREAS